MPAGDEDAVTDERRLFGGASSSRDVSVSTAAEAPARPDDRARADVAPPAGTTRPPARINAARVSEALRAALVLEWERGTAFLLLPVLFALGAILYFGLENEPSVPACAVGVAIPAAVLIGVRDRFGPRLIATGLLAAALGFGAAKLETLLASTKMLGGEISTRLTGRIVAVEHQANGRTRYILDVVATDRPQLRYAPGRVRATARPQVTAFRAGETVSGVVRLRPPSGPVFPGGYDFAFESYFDRVGATGFFLTGPERVEVSGPASLRERFGAAVENLRDRIAGEIARTIGGAEGQIAAALVAGVRAGIPEEVNEALRRTGLAHVLSISGLHMALVAGTMMIGLRAAFALFPGFASRHPTKKYAAVAALAAVTVYLFVSGGQVAAQRSSIMIAVMLAAVLFDRAALTMRNLAISALIVMAIAPHEVVGPSFQMSFAATAALIAAYGAWRDRPNRWRSRSMPESLAGRTWRTVLIYTLGLAATSIVAGLASGLYGAWHFQRVAPLGLVANLGAMPFVSAVVMPFGLIAALLMPFGLEDGPLVIMGWGLTAMLAVTDFVASLSTIDVVGIIALPAVVVMTAGLILLFLLQTWLRLVGLPLLAVGALFLFTPDRPDAYVDEGGALVAISLPGGALALNRSRGSLFVQEMWQRALAASTIVRPRSGSSTPVPSAALSSQAAGTGFACDEGNCTARPRDGVTVAIAAGAAAARRACMENVLVVVSNASVRDRCRARGSRTLSARDLALRGSAAVWFRGEGPRRRIEIRHAVGWPSRPWHRDRRFSRAARGMPPYVPANRRATAVKQVEEPVDRAAALATSSGGSDPPADPGP